MCISGMEYQVEKLPPSTEQKNNETELMREKIKDLEDRPREV